MTAGADGAPPIILRFGEVDSTQDLAFAIAAGGAPDMSVVVADSQRVGRGRHGRAWHDAPGASLLMSLLVRPRLHVTAWPTFSLAAAVAVASALGRVAGIDARVKWPNDVRSRGRKVAGILLESRLGSGVPAVVIGIGINVAQRAFPPLLAERATSLALETGAVPARAQVLEAVLDELGRWRRVLEDRGFEPVRARWLALAEGRGERVTVDGVSGVFADLDRDGALLLDADGVRHRVVAGEVREEDGHAARR
ncbi:MAG TPA: biotin--[acetyl-CoA-carboxylase] ligase [Methylomirabilota bacterium]|jgi:BirA family biotin operon repressor/biotin-[acetyl-CoA-carboxylase] ligase